MVFSRKPPAALMAPALALTVLACGGDDGSSDKDRITAIVRDVARDPATVCDHLTPALLKQLGGTKAGCVKASAAGRKNAKTSLVKVEIDGAKATATIKDAAGEGVIEFVKVDGEWLVSG
ncbi:hypothetical protein DSM112329_04455 [Paraconexibacter sp. AEG42_29]|uniref:DUF4878 domain-containing protein n=1 Tax=Paraconexibacter sp. AEG42_29 TaxID=2997339 RepID=A0AAU7B0Q2_9ACTN